MVNWDMASPPDDLSDRLLPARFFAEARAALLDSKPSIDIASTDILRISEDATLRADFRRLFRRDTNDPELKALILRYLREVADSLEDAAEVADIDVDLLDRVAMAPSAGAVVAGCAAMIATGGAIGAIVLVSGGLFGLAASGIGRTRKKRRVQKNKASRRRILGLIDDLKD